MPARVSVIIPCYAQAHFLADAVESVLGQTHPAHELIVIDDGSPDDVAAVVRAYPEVRYVRQENRGVSEARNLGIAKSSGEYVVCLDADDRLLPNALAAGAAALAAHPESGFVWGVHRCIDTGGQLLPTTRNPFTGTASYERLLRENIVGPPLVVMFRRSMLTGLGGFSPELRHVADYELLLRIVRNHPGWGHGELVAEYRVHAANMSLDLGRMLEYRLRVLELQEPRIGSDPRLRRALRRGRRFSWETYDGGLRQRELAEHARARRWWRASLAGLMLALKYPRIVFANLGRRIRAALGPAAP